MAQAQQDLKIVSKQLEGVVNEVKKVMVGQEDIIKQTLICILCDGNALLEGYPGLGKTTLVNALAQAMNLDFSRIQGTPDLMPSDVTGTYVIEESQDGQKHFTFQQGPIFANIVLFDEINRATPRTQSALLEAMQERQVTVGNTTFTLEEPFFVLATQNPIDLEGTYPLPEAQTDRFLLKMQLTYPDPEEEVAIIDRFTSRSPPATVNKKLTGKEMLKIQELVRDVPMASDLKKKVVSLVNKTRDHKYVQFGASPRSSLALVMTAKAKALLEGRTYVSEDDIHVMAKPVLRHRIILNFEAEKEDMTADTVINHLLEQG